MSALEIMLASEAVLAKEWNTQAEDEVWEDLGDEVTLDSPNWCGALFAELKARDFERINDPRKSRLQASIDELESGGGIRFDTVEEMIAFLDSDNKE